jgi:FkbM family methyltransferase
MKVGKKVLPDSYLAKLGNSSFVNKNIQSIRKKGFDHWRLLDHDIKMYVDPTDPHLLYMMDGKDPEQKVKEIFLENIYPGDVVIDVGSNIGDYTLLASKKVGDSGKVLSFEPLSETFLTLKRNLQLNKFTNCISFQKAVGEKPGLANLYKNNLSGTMGFLDSSLNGQNLIKRDEIEVVTIDDVLTSKHIDVANMIKIDVEGFEYEVLLGCLQSFKENKIKKILCEVHYKYLESKGKSEEIIYDLLHEHNFTITEISKRTPNRIHILATS